jgi:hypothetical protein
MDGCRTRLSTMTLDVLFQLEEMIGFGFDVFVEYLITIKKRPYLNIAYDCLQLSEMLSLERKRQFVFLFFLVRKSY